MIFHLYIGMQIHVDVHSARKRFDLVSDYTSLYFQYWMTGELKSGLMV